MLCFREGGRNTHCSMVYIMFCDVSFGDNGWLSDSNICSEIQVQ